MSEQQGHTPGPWKTVRNNHVDTDVGACRIVWSEATRLDVAYCTPLTDADNGNANARLIAAAPDLLAACEAFVAADSHDGVNLAYAMCCEAIAKAKAGAACDS